MIPPARMLCKVFCFCGYRGQRYPYGHDDLDWGVQSWNYNCATQTVRNRRQILAPLVGGTIFEAFPVFHFVVYCKLARNSRKPSLLIRFLLFIWKVSSFFWTFTKQPVVDCRNIVNWGIFSIRSSCFSSPLSIVLLET